MLKTKGGSEGTGIHRKKQQRKRRTGLNHGRPGEGRDLKKRRNIGTFLTKKGGHFPVVAKH